MSGDGGFVGFTIEYTIVGQYIPNITVIVNRSEIIPGIIALDYLGICIAIVGGAIGSGIIADNCDYIAAPRSAVESCIV